MDFDDGCCHFRIVTGVLLPLIAIILEEKGISAGINGFHATGIYLGVLLISPFIEAPLHKYGYKPIILVGGGLVAVSILAFPIWFNLYFWFILRLLIGVGIICYIFLRRLGLGR